MTKIRSYKKLVNDIINLQIPFRTEIIGYLKYKEIYPFLSIKRILQTSTKTVVITGGQHGDEIWAIHTLLKWLQQVNLNKFPNLNFVIYPVINPTGYEFGCRDNIARQDTNNAANFIKNSKVQELALLYEDIPTNINLMLDVHGDSRKKFVYLYEHKSDNLESIAQKTMLENNAWMPYLKQKTLDGYKLKNGVLNTPKEDVGIEGAVEKLSVDYTITLELPGIYDGQKRVEGGINIINSLLYNFMEIK